MRVQLFGTCLVDSYFPEVGEEPVRLLRRFGATVMYPKEQTCCGQPAYNAGYRGEAKDAAEHFLSVFCGMFMAKLPEISCALADEKADSILSTGADTVPRDSKSS